MTAARLGVAVVLALGLGCKASRPFATLPSEYADYRATRVAATLEERLAKSALYLERHPDGAYAADVRAAFDKAEPLFYAESRASIEGLEGYLGALPAGPHAALAAERLAQLRAARDAPDLLGASARATEERLEAAARGREGARDGVRAWVRAFLDPLVFQRPLADLSTDLVVAWGLSLPEPTCVEDFSLEPGADAGADDDPAGSPGLERCSKIVELPYQIPTGGSLSDRSIVLEVFVTQGDDGVFRSATLAGPDLFIRLEETVQKAPRSPDRASHRIAAIATAVDLVAGAFEQAVSTDPACRRSVVAPAVLSLACEGLEVVVRAGQAPGDDDIVEIRPAAGPPAASEASAPP